MQNFPVKSALCGESPETLRDCLRTAGWPDYRAKQVLRWIYRKRVAAWKEMANLPKELRGWLARHYSLIAADLEDVQRSGGAAKLLLRLEDGTFIETVCLRAPAPGTGKNGGRATACISTQAGCAYGCRFCASGLDGFKRDLTAGEMTAQLIQACCFQAEQGFRPARRDGLPFDNVVIMGMGEPLANYDNVMRAVRILNAPWGFGLGARRITVSTAGLVPEIRRLADEPLQFRLAVSLHAPDNETRSRLMPVNRKHPLEALLPALHLFAEQHGGMVTLEYLLIDEVNDYPEQAGRLAEIARGLHARVNLIPYNPVPGLEWRRSRPRRQIAFARVLEAQRIPRTVRREKGAAIAAACGQLRLRQAAGAKDPVLRRPPAEGNTPLPRNHPASKPWDCGGR